MGVITEGHTRPLLMLSDYTEEQQNLYNDIVTKSLSVREAERISRTISTERAPASLDPDTKMLQEKMENILGTRVSIEKKGPKGKISIEFFSEEELRAITDRIATPAPL
jgi:ParB family chromosome partitioning protein